jgi:hypothetical protein
MMTQMLVECPSCYNMTRNGTLCHDCQVPDLGASPAELDHNPESDRPVSLIDHQGSPEMQRQECDNA